MAEQKFSDRDEARVQRLLAHYEELDEDTQIAEDEAEGQTLVAVPSELVPAIRDFTVNLGTFERLATLLAGATLVAKLSKRP
jgi:hypothetical protein